MGGQTVPGGLPFPDLGDVPNAAQWIEDLAEAVDLKIAGAVTAAANDLASQSVAIGNTTAALRAELDAAKAEIAARNDHGPHHYYVTIFLPKGVYPKNSVFYVDLVGLRRPAAQGGGLLGYRPMCQATTYGGSGNATLFSVTSWSSVWNGVRLVFYSRDQMDLTGSWTDNLGGRPYGAWVTTSDIDMRGSADSHGGGTVLSITPDPEPASVYTTTVTQDANGDYVATVVTP